MLRLSRLAALALAGALLAGCGVSPAMGPLSAKAVGQGRMGAKSISMDEIVKALDDASEEASQPTQQGALGAIQYPSDAGVQRALVNVFSGATPRVVESIPTDIDEALGQNQIPAFLQQVPQVSDPEVTGYLQGVADRLTRAIGEKPFKVYVADTPMVNAFNAGGHSMVVFKGLLTSVKDESELAGVMAHEMTHGLKRHAVAGWVTQNAAAYARMAVSQQADYKAPDADLAMAQSYMMTLSPTQRGDFDFVTAFLKGKVGPEALRYVGFVYNDNFAVIAASRQMEADADTGGVRMVASAGYDPQGLVRAFDRMNTRLDGDTRYYNHPVLGARIAAIRAQIVRENLKGNDRGRDRLAAIVAKLKAGGATGTPRANAYLPLPAHAAGAGCLLEDAQQFWAVPLKPTQR